MKAEDTTALRKNRIMLIAIVAIAVIPMIAAYLLYRSAADGEPWATTNEGTLLNPVRPVEELRLTDAESGAGTSALSESGTWWLLTVTEEGCDQPCRGVLDSNLALHGLLGKDASRLRRGVVFTGGVDAIDLAGLKADFPKLFLLATEETLPPGIYLGDPLGNLILHYGFEQTGKPVLNDLKRLLKVSQVG